MTIGDAPALNPATGITLEAWVKPTAGTLTSSKPVIEKGFVAWSAPYFQYTLRLYDYGTAPQNVLFSLAVGGVKTDLEVNGGFRVDVWNHLVATYDGANMRLYRNGAEIASKAQTGVLSNYATPLVVGCSEHRDKAPDYCYRGETDEVAVYGRALTAAEIQAHYRAVVPAGAPAPLTAPTVSGSSTQGQILTATSGSWSGSPSSYAYQWKRCSSGSSFCADISGATASTYTTGATDAGKMLRVAVTASNASGAVRESRDDADTVLDWADELRYPGARAKAGDVASPSNWGKNPVPHIHLQGAGRGGHVPIEPGVSPRG